MDSLTFEERTENLSTLPEDGMVIIERLARALPEYLAKVEQVGSSVTGVEDFCCWIHNETAAERDEWRQT
jgi:hypothetical protein